MKLLKYIIPIITALALSACGNDDDEPKLIVDFSVTCDHQYSDGLEVEFTPNKNGGTLNAIGWECEYTLNIKGVYDYFLLAEGTPNWITVSTTSSQINLSIDKMLGDENARTGYVRFYVFKGEAKTEGIITVIQSPITKEELEEREQYFIASSLAGKTVINTLPSNNDFVVGADAPFYKIADNAYMQVVSLGTDGSPKNGNTVYFRFTRFRLIDYINGQLNNGEGNTDGLTPSATSFVIGSNNTSTTQWGIAIPKPMQLGLPYGTQVNMIVGSSAGFEDEKPYYEPYFYNVQYFKPAI